MPKVSVIIPVYNVEKYLRRCLDSVINQTLKDIEIICIDDGSTDSSLSILNEYAQIDNRIVVINKKNEGVSIARNIGIKNANAEYLCFLDSDDWLETDILEKTYNQISKSGSDIICFGIKEHFNNYSKIRSDFEIIQNHYNDEFLNKNVIKKFLLNAAAKLYKKDFIREKNIYFLENIKSCEDGTFNLFCLYNNATWSLLPECGYNYRRDRDESITYKKDLIIKTDIEGFEKILINPLFIYTSKENKIITIEKFLSHFKWNFTRRNAIKNIKFIQKFKKYLFKTVDNDILNEVSNIKEFNRYTLTRYILQTIFDIRNEYNGDQKTKIITIFGIKIKKKYHNKGDKNAKNKCNYVYI